MTARGTFAIVLALAVSGCQHLYVDAGVSVADSGVERYYVREVFIVTPGQPATAAASASVSDRVAQNPYGFLELGLELPITRRCSLNGSIRHDSSLATDADRGVNTLSAHARCFMFARREQ